MRELFNGKDATGGTRRAEAEPDLRRRPSVRLSQRGCVRSPLRFLSREVPRP
jgi:hypothetical protein